MARPCFLLLLLLIATTTTTLALDVKWTPNKEGDTANAAAATAPRSQKYWDENGIERPDYAKTDAELIAEGKLAPSSPLMSLVILAGIAGVGYYFYQQQQQNGSTTNYPSGAGNRLQERSTWSIVGGSSGRTLTDSELHKARLARFDPPDLSTFEAKDD